MYFLWKIILSCLVLLWALLIANIKNDYGNDYRQKKFLENTSTKHQIPKQAMEKDIPLKSKTDLVATLSHWHHSDKTSQLLSYVLWTAILMREQI